MKSTVAKVRVFIGCSSEVYTVDNAIQQNISFSQPPAWEHRCLGSSSFHARKLELGNEVETWFVQESGLTSDDGHEGVRSWHRRCPGA